MSLLFSLTDEANEPFDFDWKGTAEETVAAALSVEGFKAPCQVSVTITDEENIRRMNKEYRDIDSATDVLSFPLIGFQRDEAGGFDYEGHAFDAGDTDPDTNEVMLGDIVLCIERIRAQAEEYGHSEKREYAFLICHSMLHLLGHDHEAEDERLLMETEQKKIMERVNILR